MTELEEFDQTLNAELDKLQKEIEALAKKEYSQKNQSIKKCQNQVKSISTLIESYELEISNLDRSQGQKYTDSLKSINQRFQRLKSELEFKKNEGLNQENLFKDRQQPQDPSQMNSQQMIDLGDQTQQKAMNSLDSILATVNAGNQLANEISESLDKQIAQLDRMYNTVKDTQSTLKRSQKYIKYFARQIYTDKFLMCLMGLIFISIVVLIILSSMGYTGKGKHPATTTASTSSTSGGTGAATI